MGRDNERRYQMPLLYEVAVRGGKVSSHRGNTQLARIRNRIATCFHVDEQARQERYPWSGKKKFESEVNYAKKQLDSAGDLNVKRNKEWAIEEKGLQKLKEFFVIQLRHLTSKARNAYFLRKDVDGNELSIDLLRRIDSTTLKELICCASSVRELPLLALEKLPLEEFRQFLVAGDQYNADLLFRTWTPAEFHV